MIGSKRVIIVSRSCVESEAWTIRHDDYVLGKQRGTVTGKTDKPNVQNVFFFGTKPGS